MAFDIPESFKPKNKVFTTPVQAFIIAQQQVGMRAKSAVMRSNIDVSKLSSDTFVASSMFGTPVYDQIVLKVAIDSVNVNEVIKFDSVLVTVNQTRNIVTTPIQGRNGTVKEYISDGDFDINISGVITSELSKRSPLEMLENLYSMFSLQNEIVVVSDFLSKFKIQYAVVRAYKFNQVEGTINQIQMDLNLLSDEPVELELGII